MQEIKEWTHDELLLLLNSLSYGIDNELLPNALEKAGLPKKDLGSIWRDEKLLQAYYHFNNLIAKRLATEPRLPMPLVQMIDTALDSADALILLHNVKINTEDDMREFLRRFNFSVGRFPVEDMEAGRDIPLHAFLNKQEILRAVTQKVLKSVEDGQKPEFTAIETNHLEDAFRSDPTLFSRHGPGTFYGPPGGFDREAGTIEGYVSNIEEFEELWKDLKIRPIGYRSPRQGNPGLITFGRAFWKLQEILHGKYNTEYRLCTIPDCGTLFVYSSKGKGKPRSQFCSDPCYKRYHNEYNKLYMKHVKRAKPEPRGKKKEERLEWVKQETLKSLSNTVESVS